MRHDADGATDGVGAEQGALGSLENFDAIHVQQILVGTDGARQIHTVDIHADAGIQVECEIVLADAADGRGQHRAIAGERCAGIDVNAGGQVAEGVNVGEIATLYGVRGERGYRDGHLLDVLLAALGGHHDLLDLAGPSRPSRSARRLLRLGIECGTEQSHAQASGERMIERRPSAREPQNGARIDTQI